jgi:hypothetical protein
MQAATLVNTLRAQGWGFAIDGAGIRVRSPRGAKHGQDILYAGGELRRLIRSAPPQRAVTAVLGAALEHDALPGLDR